MAATITAVASYTTSGDTTRSRSPVRWQRTVGPFGECGMDRILARMGWAAGFAQMPLEVWLPISGQPIASTRLMMSGARRSC